MTYMKHQYSNIMTKLLFYKINGIAKIHLYTSKNSFEDVFKLIF